LDANSLRSIMKQLSECMVKNQQQRSKFGHLPLKFKDSEVALNDVVQELAMKLPESPHLFRDFVSMKGVDYVLQLLMHENIDIVSTIIVFIKELSEADNYDESETAIIFVVRFIEQKGVDLLLQNLKRLHDGNMKSPSSSKDGDDEHGTVGEEEDDSQTIFAILSILENLSEIDIDFCIDIVGQCKFFKILLHFMRKKQELSVQFDEIQLYLSELLCIYLQPMDDDVSIYQQFSATKGCDKVLSLLESGYSTKDPTLSEEKEYVCNLLDALTAALASTANQDQFHQSPTAMTTLLSLIKSRRFVKFQAIQALSFAVTNHHGNCLKLVECSGLKTVFAVFMHRKGIKKRYKKDHDGDRMEEWCCSVLVHLFCNLSDVPLWRLMRKFMEKEFSKIDRVVELHSKYMARLEDYDRTQRKAEGKGIRSAVEREEERYSKRLEHGLYTLQMVDIVIAFIYTFPAGDGAKMKERIAEVLNQSDSDIDDVKAVLMEYFKITNSNQKASGQGDGGENEIDDMSLGSIAGKLVDLM